jgi:hypothetical protein
MSRPVFIILTKRINFKGIKNALHKINFSSKEKNSVFRKNRNNIFWSLNDKNKTLISYKNVKTLHSIKNDKNIF